MEASGCLQVMDQPEYTLLRDLGVRVYRLQGLGFRVWGLGFRVLA